MKLNLVRMNNLLSIERMLSNYFVYIIQIEVEFNFLIFFCEIQTLLIKTRHENR